MSFYVTFEGYITDEMGTILSPDEVERSLEAILDELLARGVPDSTVGGTLARAVIEISVTVEAKSLEEAQAKGLGIILEAIHSAGGYTHEVEVDWVAATMRRSDSTEGHRPDLVGA